MKPALVAFVLAQVGDAVTTCIALLRYGGIEANPAMALAFAHSPFTFLAVKAVGTAVVTYMFWGRRHIRAAVHYARACAIFMALVVVWNLAGIAHVA